MVIRDNVCYNMHSENTLKFSRRYYEIQLSDLAKSCECLSRLHVLLVQKFPFIVLLAFNWS